MSVRNDIMDNVLDACKTIRSSDDYEATLAADPTPFKENYLNMTKDQTPVLMIADQGNDIVLVQSATETMFKFDLSLFGYVAESAWEDAQRELNAILASVKKLINSGPDIGTAVLKWRFVEGLGVAYDNEGRRGWTTIQTTILYKVTNGVY